MIETGRSNVRDKPQIDWPLWVAVWTSCIAGGFIVGVVAGMLYQKGGG